MILKIAGQDSEAVAVIRSANPGRSRDVREGAVAAVAKQMLPCERQSSRSAENRHALPQALGVRAWQRSRGEVEVHITSHKEIKLAVAVVVQKGATRAPVVTGGCEACPRADVCKGSVAVVAVENVWPAVVGHKQVVQTIVVVVAHADALAPTRTLQPGRGGDVRERAVAIVVEETVGRVLIRREAPQAASVHHEDVGIAVAVVIDKGDAAAGAFEDVSFGGFTTVDDPNLKTGLFGDARELYR